MWNANLLTSSGIQRAGSSTINDLSRKAHELLSENFLLPLWHLQRLVRPSRRAIELSILKGLSFRRKTEAWGVEQKTSSIA